MQPVQHTMSVNLQSRQSMIWIAFCTTSDWGFVTHKRVTHAQYWYSQRPVSYFSTVRLSPSFTSNFAKIWSFESLCIYDPAFLLALLFMWVGMEILLLRARLIGCHNIALRLWQAIIHFICFCISTHRLLFAAIVTSNFLVSLYTDCGSRLDIWAQWILCTASMRILLLFLG